MKTLYFHSLILLFGLIFFTVGGCIKNQSMKVPSSFQLMSECNRDSKIEEIVFQDFQNASFAAFWTDAAAASCPGPLHPRLMVDAPKVDQWIQIISVNIPPPVEEPYLGPSWNLTGETHRWTYLDVLPEKAKQKHFFYNDSPSSQFHDNPHWSGRPPNGRIWEARLWGFRTNSNGELEPVVGLKWGFTNDPQAETPLPIRPWKLSISDWPRDRFLLRKLAKAWKVKPPKLR